MLRKVCFEWYYNDDRSLWLEFIFRELAIDEMSKTKMILFETNPSQFCSVYEYLFLVFYFDNAFYKMLKSSNTKCGNLFLKRNIFEMDRMRIIIPRDTHHNNSYLKFSIFYQEINNLACLGHFVNLHVATGVSPWLWPRMRIVIADVISLIRLAVLCTIELNIWWK